MTTTLGTVALRYGMDGVAAAADGAIRPTKSSAVTTPANRRLTTRSTPARSPRFGARRPCTWPTDPDHTLAPLSTPYQSGQLDRGARLHRCRTRDDATPPTGVDAALASTIRACPIAC